MFNDLFVKKYSALLPADSLGGKINPTIQL